MRLRTVLTLILAIAVLVLVRYFTYEAEDGVRPPGNTYVAASPDWSPDGLAIAFDANRDGSRSQLYAVRPDGTGLRRLFRSRTNDFDPSWSPDGKKIVFVSSPRPGWDENARLEEMEADLFVIDADGGNRRRLTRNRVDEHSPAWSPDGTRIAFMREEGVYVIPASGGRAKRLSRVRDDTGLSWSGSSGLSWSPDGRRLAASLIRPGGFPTITTERKERPAHWANPSCSRL